MPNSSNSLKGIVALSVCAFIWGTSFVAQSLGADYAEPFTFNCGRSVIATVFLFLVCPILDRLSHKPYYILGSNDPALQKLLLKSGFLCGAILTAAIYMQQWGIMYTTAGKSGFITALYIVLVPLIGSAFYHKQVGWQNWLSVVIAVIGMYFICITEAFTIGKGDLITTVCPFAFALQILVVDEVIDKLDGVRLSMIQFGSCALLNGILMCIFENPTLKQITDSMGPLLYLGIMSCGIAYTLQIIGQKYTSPVLASMLMSLESVFALLSGWVILNQQLTLREAMGCTIMFAAVILAQIPLSKQSKEEI